MTKTLGQAINNIMEENSTSRVLILTDKFHIVGTIHEYPNNCQNCHDCIISLKDVKIAKIEDLCSCKVEDCECNLDAFIEYKWFNINVNAIVGFSILG